MILRVKAELSEPPSSTSCFRDVTLYAHIFCDLDVLVECLKGTRSIYWKWLKSLGAHDFVDQLVITGEVQDGISLGPRKSTISVSRLDAHSLPRVVERLMGVTEGRCGI